MSALQSDQLIPAIKVLVEGQTVLAARCDHLGFPGLFQYPSPPEQPTRFWRLHGAGPNWTRVEEVTDMIQAHLAAEAALAVKGSQIQARILTAKKRQATVNAALREPQDWQERHSPTEPVVLRDLGGRGKRVLQTARRRKVDARIWEGLSSYQHDAAEAIMRGYHELTRGLGFGTMPFQQPEVVMALSYRSIDRDQQTAYRLHDLSRWMQRAEAQGIDWSAILSVLVMGYSLRDQDLLARRRKGWARQNLADGLDLFCRLKGWPTKNC